METLSLSLTTPEFDDIESLFTLFEEKMFLAEVVMLSKIDINLFYCLI